MSFPIVAIALDAYGNSEQNLTVAWEFKNRLADVGQTALLSSPAPVIEVLASPGAAILNVGTPVVSGTQVQAQINLSGATPGSTYFTVCRAYYAANQTLFVEGKIVTIGPENTNPPSPPLPPALQPIAANQVYAGPAAGSAATPVFRALVGADLPNPLGPIYFDELNQRVGVGTNTPATTFDVVGPAPNPNLGQIKLGTDAEHYFTVRCDSAGDCQIILSGDYFTIYTQGGSQQAAQFNGTQLAIGSGGFFGSWTLTLNGPYPLTGRYNDESGFFIDGHGNAQFNGQLSVGGPSFGAWGATFNGDNPCVFYNGSVVSFIDGFGNANFTSNVTAKKFIPQTVESVTGSKDGNAALASLIAIVVNLGLATDGTT